MSILAGIPLVGDLIKLVFGSKFKRDQFQADARSSVYQQFAAEFGHSKTWWDSLIDGLNRLPRPFMTFGTIYLFWLCWSDPVSFIQGASALQAMPKEGWYILGAIVTFWFAAKLPKDFGKYKKGDFDKQIEKARSVIATAPGTNAPISKDPQEGIDWSDKIEKRYSDWDNLNE